jgi:hypothetical protein
VYLPFRDVEVDAVERDDLAERFADPARANREGGRRPGGDPPGRRAFLRLGTYPDARQFVSELGM